MASYLFCLMVVTICFQFSYPLPNGGSRHKRHADGLFTSELSKIKNDVAMRNYLRLLLSSKRSISETNYPKDSGDYETECEETCFTWLYQSLLIESIPENEALNDAQKSCKLIYRLLGSLIVKLKENIPLEKLLDVAE